MKDLSRYYEKVLNLDDKALTLTVLDPNLLLNDHQHYQRYRIEHKVLHRMKHWDKEDYNSGIVALRTDDSYWIINGQHHADAAVRLGVNTVHYYVFDSAGWAAEKIIFDLFQKLQQQFSALTKPTELDQYIING
jgi:hypothetical protein